MKNIKFVVKVNRGDTHAPEYVQRVDPTPIHMTTNRKRALVMGKFMAEDAVKSPRKFPAQTGVGLGTGRCLEFVLKTVTRTGSRRVWATGSRTINCRTLPLAVWLVRGRRPPAEAIVEVAGYSK
jgi:hypothetical protein